MGLSAPLLRGVFAYGFEKPSAIQQRAIVSLLSGQDTVAQAQSGTGKTAAWALGILGRIDVLAGVETQALILVTSPN